MAIPTGTNRDIPVSPGNVIDCAPSGTIYPYDFVTFSAGNTTVAASSVSTAAPATRTLGAGIALESSVQPDSFGADQTPDTIRVLRRGVVELRTHSSLATAAPLGQYAYPRAKGSGAFPIAGGTGSPASYLPTPTAANGIGKIIASRVGYMTVALDL